jgi:dTDP-4-dehydrorhamnose 3,5-epimerase
VSWLTATSLPLQGLRLVNRHRAFDTRGFLSRIFCRSELAEAGWNRPVAQINHSQTIQIGTVRGLHYQRPPHAEMKLVTCIRGEVFDVAVDVRTGSPTFLQWHGQRLSAERGDALLIPKGFAHGFQTLSDYAELIYLHSEDFAPDAEAVLNPLDTRLSIAWPLPVRNLSSRDSNADSLPASFTGISV